MPARTKCSQRMCKAMSDECHVAHCDDKSGECKLEARPNGTACGNSLADLCTQHDTCQAGVCKANDVAEGTPCGDQASIATRTTAATVTASASTKA